MAFTSTLPLVLRGAVDAPNTNGVFGLPLMATSSYNTLHD